MARSALSKTAQSPALPRAQTSPMAWTTVALLIGINVLWGGSSLAAKTALISVPPMTLAFMRFSLAAVLMYGVTHVRKIDLRVARADWGRFWAFGLLGLALTYLLQYAGILRTTATDASLLISTEPVYLAVLAFFFLRERMTVTKFLGIAAGLGGVYLIITNDWMPQNLGAGVIGDSMIALGLVFEALSSIVGKGLVSKYPAIAVITYQMTIGALALAPFAILDFAHGLAAGHSIHFTFPAILSLFYLVIPCTVFAYTVWFTILDKRDAGEMSVFLYIQPLVGAALGSLFNHDTLTAFTAGGAGLVLLSLALIKRPAALPPASPAPPTV